jgi:peptidoglycan/LPS O-acetylase OafA/YrhL
MGFYRLFLAILVALSHMDVRWFGYNPGAIAVISFYILSGYFMSLLITKYYPRTSMIPAFYLDRCLRILPQFIFYMLVASACIYWLKIDSPAINRLTPIKWLMNFLILPQGFYMLWGENALVLPQSWSLGLEMTFYLVIPWILTGCSKRQIYTLAGLSCLIFLAAYCNKIDSDYFGYRLLPGTLFIFLTGWSFFQPDRNSRYFRIITLLSAVLLWVIAFLNQSIYHLPHNKEILVGLIIGILIINPIKDLQFSRLDTFLGNLSYGVFLNHYILIWLAQKFFLVTQFDIKHITLLLLASGIIASGSYYYIERPALAWRHAVRHKIARSEPSN